MNKKIKLYIVDSNSNFIDKIEGWFFERPTLGITVNGSTTNTNYFEKDKQNVAQADIYLVSANLPDGTGIKIVEFLRKNSVTSSKPIIFTIDKQTRNHATIAREKGVDKIFQKPFSMKDLIQTISDLTNTSTPMNVTGSGAEEEQKNKKIGKIEAKEKKVEKTVEKPAKPLFTPTENDDLFQKIENNPLLNVTEFQKETKNVGGKIKSVVSFGSVSSTGKTSLIVNVAYAIRKYAKVKPSICIVDLNLLFPSVSYHFLSNEVKSSTRDIYDISEDLNYINEELLSEAIIFHEPSGIHILNTPSDPEFIHKINSVKSEQIEKILVHLRDMFDLILIDTSNQITEDLVLFPMQFSDKNIIVLEPNYLNVVGVNKFFTVLKQLEESIKEPILSKTHIVLNKETKNKSIYTDTARDFLYNKKFITRVPDDEKFIDFSNKGKFLIDSGSIATSAILDLANFIYPINPEETKEKRKTIFKFLKDK